MFDSMLDSCIDSKRTIQFSEAYLTNREIRSNVAKANGCSFKRKHYLCDTNILGAMFGDTALGQSNDRMSILSKMYDEGSSISDYSSSRLNFNQIKDTTVIFYPTDEVVMIDWSKIDFSELGFPINIIVKTTESGFSYTARISYSINGKRHQWISNSFDAVEQAILALKQMEFMKDCGFF